MNLNVNANVPVDVDPTVSANRIVCHHAYNLTKLHVSLHQFCAILGEESRSNRHVPCHSRLYVSHMYAFCSGRAIEFLLLQSDGVHKVQMP